MLSFLLDRVFGHNNFSRMRMLVRQKSLKCESPKIASERSLRITAMGAKPDIRRSVNLCSYYPKTEQP